MKIWTHGTLSRDSLQFQCWDKCDSSWYKEKIKFYGLNDNYKGEIGFDIDSKKNIIFWKWWKISYNVRWN